MNYGFISKDPAYERMRLGSYISKKFPYKYDIEPRLVRYLRDYYFYKIIGIVPCVPLVVQYWIRINDIICINKYLYKYKIKI